MMFSWGTESLKKFRHEMLIYDNPNVEAGDVVAVEHGWVRGIAILPHRTISGRWIWGPAYYRRVWVYTGFVDEPETQWGNLFDVLNNV